jgi:hypothetical protein
MSIGELVIGELDCENFVVPNISSSYVLDDETSEAIGDDGKGEEEDETGEE